MPEYQKQHLNGKKIVSQFMVKPHHSFAIFISFVKFPSSK